jgi:hypothetical protein
MVKGTIGKRLRDWALVKTDRSDLMKAEVQRGGYNHPVLGCTERAVLSGKGSKPALFLYHGSPKTSALAPQPALWGRGTTSSASDIP